MSPSPSTRFQRHFVFRATSFYIERVRVSDARNDTKNDGFLFFLFVFIQRVDHGAIYTCDRVLKIKCVPLLFTRGRTKTRTFRSYIRNKHDPRSITDYIVDRAIILEINDSSTIYRRRISRKHSPL